MRHSNRLIMGACALLAASCVSGESRTIASTEQLVRSPNGVSLNGVSLNGVSLNGVSLNGVSLNGVSLNGVSLNGVSLNGVSLNGVSLNGVSLNGVSLNGVSLNGSVLNSTTGGYTGASLVGAALNGLLSNGSTLKLRIDAYRSETDSVSSLSFYKVSYQTSSGWSLLGPAGTNEAVALAGRWDYSQGTSTGGSWINDSSAITFGCTATALGKCAHLGYRPWVTYAGTSLRPYHQACTRMIRADYCGNGTPYTVDGTTINLYDRLSIETDTDKWKLEAEWKASGAHCIKDTANLRLQLLGISVPSCVSSLVSSGCGSFGSTGGSLLITEYVQ